jgi:hypothetical protein
MNRAFSNLKRATYSGAWNMINRLAMFTAGSAGGKVKTGYHIQGNGEPGTRLGYTIMKVMGLDINSWGTLSNTTSKEFGEILV